MDLLCSSRGNNNTFPDLFRAHTSERKKKKHKEAKKKEREQKRGEKKKRQKNLKACNLRGGITEGCCECQKISLSEFLMPLTKAMAHTKYPRTLQRFQNIHLLLSDGLENQSATICMYLSTMFLCQENFLRWKY